MDPAFFCTSGTEANEALLKLARHHFYLKGQKDRYRIIAFEEAFHGRTLGALSMTGRAKYREGFGPYEGGVTHVPYGDLVCRLLLEKKKTRAPCALSSRSFAPLPSYASGVAC